MKQIIVATHPGTGTDIVAAVLADLGHKLVEVTGRKAAHKVEFAKLILLGGADISPFWYGETPVYTGPLNHERDIIEWTLIRRAMAEHKPILGICRGHQLLTVAHGGSLYQDIFMQTRRRHGYGSRHELKEVRQPLKRKLPRLDVNSLHHQSVKTVPAGMQVMALSPEGIVESIWKPGVLGVQFHPELMIGADPAWEKLFRWFTDENLI